MAVTIVNKSPVLYSLFYLIFCYLKGYDVPVLSRNLDWISVMAYDYHGQWDKKTGHVAPMYAHPDDYDMKFNSVILLSLDAIDFFTHANLFIRITLCTIG